MMEPDPHNPYATPTAKVDRPDEPLIDGMQMASRLSRLGANILDSIFLLLLSGAIALMFYYGNGEDAWLASLLGEDEDALPLGALVGITAVMFGSFAVLNVIPLMATGQTLAKRILGIRIVTEDGQQAGLARCLLRFMIPGLINQIPFVGHIFALVNALRIFHSDHRCLHDIMFQTRVVKV